MAKLNIQHVDRLKILTQWFGLWPYDSNLKRYFWYILDSIFQFVILIPRLIFFLDRSAYNLDDAVQNSLDVLTQMLHIIIHSVIFFNAARLRKVLMRISNDRDAIPDESELEILNKWSEKGYWLVKWAAFFLSFGAPSHFATPCVPPLLDIIFPLENTTHPRVTTFHANFIFFRETDYHYQVSLFFLLPYSYLVFSFVASGSFFALILHHSLGLFGVTRYRLETLAKPLQKSNEKFQNFDRFIQYKLARVIEMHNKSIEYVELLEDMISLTQLMGQGVAVMTISIFFFYFSKFEDINFFSGFYVMPWALAMLVALYVLHWTGQQTINSSEKIFFVAYSSQWYGLSSNNCMTLRIIMIRSLHPCELTCGKLFVLSFESFSRFMNTAISYMMILRNVTQPQ